MGADDSWESLRWSLRIRYGVEESEVWRTAMEFGVSRYGFVEQRKVCLKGPILGSEISWESRDRVGDQRQSLRERKLRSWRYSLGVGVDSKSHGKV